jgi:hypothetical protein
MWRRDPTTSGGPRSSILGNQTLSRRNKIDEYPYLFRVFLKDLSTQLS